MVKKNLAGKKTAEADVLLYQQKQQQPLRRTKNATRDKFICLPSITTIKHRTVLEAFSTLFEAFPVKIAELAALKDSAQYRMTRTDVFTDPSTFLGPVPPSLKIILKEQQKGFNQNSKLGDSLNSNSICCNWNRQVPLFLTYDGNIPSNAHLLEIATKLEAYCHFYADWFVQWANAVKLMKLEVQAENAHETDVQDAVFSTLEEIYGSISNFSNFSIEMCIDRFGGILKMQQNPHIEDYRHDFTISERTVWCSLVFLVRKLYAYFVRTYDVVAKNVDKLI